MIPLYIQAYTQAYIHTNMRTCWLFLIERKIFSHHNAQMNTYKSMCVCFTHNQTVCHLTIHTYIYKHTCMHMYKHIHRHTRARAHTHTHTHTHMPNEKNLPKFTHIQITNAYKQAYIQTHIQTHIHICRPSNAQREKSPQDHAPKNYETISVFLFGSIKKAGLPCEVFDINMKTPNVS